MPRADTVTPLLLSVSDPAWDPRRPRLNRGRKLEDGAAARPGVPVLAYGNFITVAVNFLILAFIIFMMVKQINRLKRAPAPAAPAELPPPAEDIVLLREIRDALRR